MQQQDNDKPGPCILLLDDDTFMLGLQTRMLHRMGYQHLATAVCAADALATIEKASPPVDIVICDLNMPAIDGVEFLQLLNAGTYRCSVILLSGEGARLMHSVQRLLAGGRLTVLGAIEKPAQPTALLALLEAWRPCEAKTPATRPALEITTQELADATAKRQWTLHYQPKVDLKTGALEGMEALIRWNHPRLGLLYPDSFISMAEDSGVIDAMTQWVLQESCEQMMRWHGDSLKIGVAVNLSMESLRNPGFASTVNALVRGAGASPQYVTLEITESRLMSPSPAPLESLIRLRLKRFGLSIDDFGTGHSSLAQLRDVPFTELKVDRGFVRNACSNQIIRPILEGSIGLARRLGMVSVAEGVETLEDWNFLREGECDVAQGYFIARPMAVDRVCAWLLEWKARQALLVPA